MGLLQTVRFALQRVRGKSAAQCAHLDQIREVTPSSTGCQPCLELGDSWVHLRMCMTDGLVLCCDPRRTSTPAATPASTLQTIRSSARWNPARTGFGATPMRLSCKHHARKVPGRHPGWNNQRGSASAASRRQRPRILTAMQRDLSRRFAADYRIVTADTPRLPSPRSNSVIKSPW